MLIAHATDLSGDDDAAFVHACALAATSGARLVTIHGHSTPESTPDLPDAAALATKWQRPIDHARIFLAARTDTAASTVITAMQQLRPDLVVVGTHARHGLAALLKGSVGEAIARNLTVPTLVVPNQGRGFVDAASGKIDLHRILVPSATVEHARRGIEGARQLAALANVVGPAFELVHIGSDEAALESLAVGATLIREHGQLEEAIIDVARARNACVVVMTTHGHDGLGDMLLGSHTERVIRNVARPVLSLPW